MSLPVSADVRVLIGTEQYEGPFSVRMLLRGDDGVPRALVLDRTNQVVETIEPTALEQLEERAHVLVALATRATLRAEALTTAIHEWDDAVRAASGSVVPVAPPHHRPRPARSLWWLPMLDVEYLRSWFAST
jgi:hypothetical protein